MRTVSKPILWVLAGVAGLSIMAPTRSQAGQPKMEIPETRFNFGRVFERKQYIHEFAVYNHGDAELIINNVRPGCGCTVTNFDKTIMPGRQGKIEFVLDGERVHDQFNKTATVSTNDPVHPTMTIAVEGIEIPYLDIQPAGTVYLQGRYGEHVERAMTVTSNEKGLDFKILRVSSNLDDKITYKVEPSTQPGAYEVTVYKNPALPTMITYGTLFLHTNSTEAPTTPVQVQIITKGSISVSPASVNFGRGQVRRKPRRRAGDHARRDPSQVRAASSAIKDDQVEQPQVRLPSSRSPRAAVSSPGDVHAAVEDAGAAERNSPRWSFTPTIRRTGSALRLARARQVTAEGRSMNTNGSDSGGDRGGRDRGVILLVAGGRKTRRWRSHASAQIEAEEAKSIGAREGHAAFGRRAPRSYAALTEEIEALSQQAMPREHAGRHADHRRHRGQADRVPQGLPQDAGSARRGLPARRDEVRHAEVRTRRCRTWSSSSRRPTRIPARTGGLRAFLSRGDLQRAGQVRRRRRRVQARDPRSTRTSTRASPSTRRPTWTASRRAQDRGRRRSRSTSDVKSIDGKTLSPAGYKGKVLLDRLLGHVVRPVRRGNAERQERVREVPPEGLRDRRHLAGPVARQARPVRPASQRNRMAAVLRR